MNTRGRLATTYSGLLLCFECQNEGLLLYTCLVTEEIMYGWSTSFDFTLYSHSCVAINEGAMASLALRKPDFNLAPELFAHTWIETRNNNDRTTTGYIYTMAGLPLQKVSAESVSNPTAIYQRESHSGWDSLPAEMKNRIYRMVLIHDEPVCLRGARSKASWQEPSILQATKAIRAEASPIYYNENKFVIRLGKATPSFRLDQVEMLFWLYSLQHEHKNKIPRFAFSTIRFEVYTCTLKRFATVKEQYGAKADAPRFDLCKAIEMAVKHGYADEAKVRYASSPSVKSSAIGRLEADEDDSDEVQERSGSQLMRFANGEWKLGLEI